MRINYEKGSFFNGDRIITVTTQENEFFTIFKLALLVNQIAVNELRRVKQNNYKTFLFKNAIVNAIELAQAGIDWGEEKSISEVVKWCNKYHLSFEKVEPELRKNIQTKLKDYEKC